MNFFIKKNYNIICKKNKKITIIDDKIILKKRKKN